MTSGFHISPTIPDPCEVLIFLLVFIRESDKECIKITQCKSRFFNPQMDYKSVGNVEDKECQTDVNDASWVNNSNHSNSGMRQQITQFSKLEQYSFLWIHVALIKKIGDLGTLHYNFEYSLVECDPTFFWQFVAIGCTINGKTLHSFWVLETTTFYRLLRFCDFRHGDNESTPRDEPQIYTRGNKN